MVGGFDKSIEFSEIGFMFYRGKFSILHASLVLGLVAE